MVFTDPPYGINYVGKTKDALTIQNDDNEIEGTRQLVSQILLNSPLKLGGAFYVCSPPGDNETQFRLAIKDAGLTHKQTLVWVKNSLVLGRQDYHYRHESILYGWKEGASHYFIDDRTQDTVWEINRPTKSKVHPTMKPVELVLKAILNSSKAGEIVYDACGGSGSTLIACEKCNRKCRMMEIDPVYCSVIIDRWETFTGQKAVKTSSKEVAVQ